jgi:FAD/FMN-containing dehydrogenase
MTAIEQDTGLEALQLAVRGEVLGQGDPGYDEACRLWNGMIERRPAVIVRCANASDVIAAVTFAREQELPLAVRGGGHNVAGNALCDGGVVVDLSRMRGVRVDLDANTVRAEGGSTLGDVDHATLAHGLGVPFGIVSRTGIAGLTLHGGLGFLTRRLGLSCDTLIGADVVTADGRLLHVGGDKHSDLLWGLRGGGGNFGAVTSLEYRLSEVGPDVFMVITLYPAEESTECLQAFRDVMSGAPEELTAISVFWNAPQEEPVPEGWQGKPVLIVGGCWSGSLDQGEDATRALRELTTPVVDMSGPMPFVQAQQLFDPEYPDGRRYYWKSLYLDRIDEAAAETLRRSAEARPSELSSIDVWALGGALRREPDGGSAYARREDPFLVGIEANWDSPSDDEANITWARDLYRDLGQFSSGGTYLNFPGFVEEGDDLLRASYGDSYARLQEVKAKYDPDNLFRSNFNIPSSGPG